MINLPTFLPGVFALVPGTKADFFSLCRFHYLPDPPATFAQIWSITYTDSGCYSRGGDGWACGPTAKPHAARSAGSNPNPYYAAPGCSPRAVAVATVSYPTPRNRGREHFFGTAGWRYREQILFANANLRTLSRLVIHPQFRSLGLATALTRHCCLHTPTRYTESLAVMGRAHPFFERAGMRRIDPPGAPDDAPLYFIYDKGSPNSKDEIRMTNQIPRTNDQIPNG